MEKDTDIVVILEESKLNVSQQLALAGNVNSFGGCINRGAEPRGK